MDYPESSVNMKLRGPILVIIPSTAASSTDVDGSTASYWYLLGFLYYA